jgi:hypothetical protein
MTSLLPHPDPEPERSMSMESSLLGVQAACYADYTRLCYQHHLSAEEQVDGINQRKLENHQHDLTTWFSSVLKEKKRDKNKNKITSSLN